MFTPQRDNKVSLYTCGPTVYNFLHVGNWAAYIYWDTLVRVLHSNDFDVERVMNITDVGHLVSDGDDGEDKLEKGARLEGKTAWDIAETYTNDFLEGMVKLGLIMPEHVVKATDFIPQQLELVRVLQEKGYTYTITDGIYFDTSKFASYADFAELDLAAQKAGARVEINPEKRNPSDFALWKFTAADETRDMQWETPSELVEDGKSRDANSHMPIATRQPMGFPGWHLECSAMAMSILGPTLDIHTGGIDHIPVHHTNEIAQSESASGQQFARFWLHNNHLKVNGTKISKSLGNGYTLQDLAEKDYTPMDFRMFILQSQYSNEGNFTFENLTAAKNRLFHWRNIAALRHQIHDTLSSDSTKSDEDILPLLATNGAIREAVNNDLNTPVALRIIDEIFSKLDTTPIDTIQRHGLEQLLQTIDDILGLQLLATTPDISDDAKQLILARERAREDKDFQASDTLRTQLVDMNVLVRDTSHGTIWEYLS